MTINLFKTQLRLDFSFIFVSTAMLIFCNELIVLIAVVSSLLHELGHLAVMGICGEKVRKIIFGAFGVRIEKYSFSGLSYKKEIAVALGGIAMNFIVALISLAFYGFCKKQVFICTAIINLMIAFTNMIPINMLDMGKALENYLLMTTTEEKAMHILHTVSFFCSVVFFALAVLYCIFIKVNISLVAVALYLCFNFKELK